MNNRYNTYLQYHSLRLHFNNPKFNYFNSRPKINYVDEGKLIIASRILEKYKDETKNFLVSSFIKNNKTWITDLLTEEYQSNYINWKKRNNSLTYQFKHDIIYLSNLGDFNSWFKKSEPHPIIMKELLQNNICIETFCILNSYVNFYPYFDRINTNDPIWIQLKLKGIKYFPFIHYDKCVLKSILLENINTTVKLV